MIDNKVVVKTPISFKNKKVFLVAPHPDDDAIGCGALLFYLSKMAVDDRPKSIHIAYAVSGFNGVSECFLKKSGFDEKSFNKKSAKEQRDIKSKIRVNEAIECCNFLGAEPIFWNLPFYEKQEKTISQADIEIALKSIKNVDPDIIILIDESNDPHGTHGMVQQVVLETIRKTSFKGNIVGYRVWEEGYDGDECDISIFFDENIMKEKEKLASFYESQMIDPAFPCKYHSFIKLLYHNNLKMAKLNKASLPFAECYKVFN